MAMYGEQAKPSFGSSMKQTVSDFHRNNNSKNNNNSNNSGSSNDNNESNDNHFTERKKRFLILME